MHSRVPTAYNCCTWYLTSSIVFPKADIITDNGWLPLDLWRTQDRVSSQQLVLFVMISF